MTDKTTGATPLKDPPERLRFDVERLEKHLKTALPEAGEIVSVKQFAGGQSNPTYKIEAEGGAYVLRRKPPGDLLPSAHAVDREHRVMTALHAAGFPAPRTRLYCADESVVGTPFFLMDFVGGRIFWSARIPEVESAERAAIYDAMGDVLADLHRVDYAAAGLSDYGKPEGYLARQIARWTKQYRAAQTADIPAMEKLIDWLPKHAPAEGGRAIVHGDFRIDNLIFHPAEPRVIAVLDWELSTLGDPLADLTYLLMQWWMPEDFRGGLLGADLDALGIPSVEAFAARYEAKTGLGAPAALPVYLAFNMFRLAGILQGVVARGRAGNASSEEAASYEASIPLLADLAWSLAANPG